MKKFLKALTAILAVAVLAFALVGCANKYGAVKKAYEDAGYTVQEIKASDYETQLKSTLNVSDEQYECIKDNNILFASKGVVSIAVVLSFTNNDELKDYCSKKTEEFYQQMVDGGYVNGNCLLLTLSSSAREIFKNA